MGTLKYMTEKCGLPFTKQSIHQARSHGCRVNTRDLPRGTESRCRSHMPNKHRIILWKYRDLSVYDEIAGVASMVELEHSRELLSNFGLTTAAELLDARLEDASQSEMTYITFLRRLLEAEEQKRKQRSEETRLKLSRLPHRKTLDEFDFCFQPSIDTRLMSELGNTRFRSLSQTS